MSRILIVDDHANNRELVVTLVRHMGHEPIEAVDGAEGLAQVRATRPQLVICDILMPTMDGYEFVRQLRADPEIADTEVIFYTANYHVREAQHLADAIGVTQVLIKPCEPEEIISCIDYALHSKPRNVPVADFDEFDREHLRLITDKLAEKADDLQLANQRLSALTDLNLQLASVQDPDILLKKVCHGSRELLGSKYAIVCIKAKNNGQAVYHYSSGLDEGAAAALECPKIDAGLFAEVFTKSRSRRVINRDGNPESIGFPPSYPKAYVVLIAPIVSLRLNYGWICLVDKIGAEEFSAEDERLLTIHAAQVGRIYENGSLYKQIERRATELTAEIVERKNAEEKVSRLNRVYAMLSGINSLIVRARDRDHLFREACRIATETGDFISAHIGFRDSDRDKFRLAAISNLNAAQIADLESEFSNLEDATPTVRDILHRLLVEAEPVIYNDAEADLPNTVRNNTLLIGAQSAAILPLTIDGITFGFFVLRSQVQNYFDEQEIRLLKELADDISFAVDHINKAEKLEYLAYHDALTGLANRTLFLDRLTRMVEQSGRANQTAAILIMDIDRFKAINDAFGRPAGDDLLKQIVARFAEDLKDQDQISCARLSADNFAILLPQVGAADEVARLIESKLKQFFGSSYRIGNTDLRVSAKVGAALFPDDGRDAEVLFRNAEAALKNAKARGERYMFHTLAMTERVAEHLSLENRLRRAVEQEEFVLHYQPKVTLVERRIAGVEALIRWNDPQTGLVPPLQFIPLLEETGLINEVGSWALRQAIADHARWRDLGLASPHVAVNVSAIQLRNGNFVEAVRREIGQGIEPVGIDLEITESVIMDDIEGNIRKLNALRDMGIGISIDDFGTGYSSLAYLAKLPVSEIKIDRGFIVSLLRDDNARTLVLAIIAMAHSMNLSVVAEGVEEEAQAEVLLKFGCERMQGYLFCRPVPFEEMAALLARETSKT